MRKLGFVVAFGLFAFPTSALTQSILNFPRVISSDQVFTGIAVGNPTSVTVTVTFTAYGADGSLVTGPGVENPTTEMIAAGGQLARQYSELFGSADFNGWVQATSASGGLTGFFLNANPAVTDLDGAVALAAGVEFVLPFAAEDATAKTELTVVNPGDETATATLTLYGSDGSVLETVTVTLPAKTLTRQTLGVVFPGAELETASHVVVQGDRALVAHEIVVDFQVAGTTFRRETIALGGRTPTGSTRQILPQFVTGAGWLSFLGLVNTAGTAQDVVLTARMDDGTEWDLPKNPVTVTLGAKGGWRGTVAELFGITDGAGQFRAGWVDIATPVGFLTSYIGFGNEATASFALVGGVDDTAASKLQVFSQVAEGGGFFTGLTVVNPSGSEATFEFFTLLPDGTTVGKAMLTVPANGRVGRLYRELLPASLGQVGGWAYLRSSVEVVGAALFGGTNGFALANVPAEAIATDFIPPAQVAAAITGTVRQDGVGVDDVTVSLTGPVNATGKTDAEGRYVFGQLPAGSYTVSATRLGAQVVPAERAVELALENATDQDFTAGGVLPSEAPGLSFITPSAAFTGTQLLNITVLGENFNPASVVEFSGTALQTTFVSAGELQAVITSEQLSRVQDGRITVTTLPPGGGTSTTALFFVLAVPENPLIEGRVSVGSFPAGVAIHPTRKIALVTNESSDNVSVIDLETQKVVETIGVGRSPGEGIAIHVERDLAVVANVGSNNVSVIDLETMEVTATIEVGRFPLGVAIDQSRDLAVVTNGEDGNVSLIHLPTLEVVFQVQVGERPAGVAIHEGLGLAVVANRGSDDVSVIDLNGRTNVATIALGGNFPRGVAIHEGKNLAVVANANSNTISLIDLESRQLIRDLGVGTAPTGVGIHEGTSHAVVSNSGLARGVTNLGILTTVSIVDLEGEELVEDVPVGSVAFGVDVDEASQMAVVANFGSNDVTLLRIPNPTPRVSDVEPKTFPAGGGEFEITVRGTGFVTISVVTLNGQALPTTFISSTELRAIVSAELLDQLLQVSSISTVESGVRRFAQTNPPEFNIGVTTGDKSSSTGQGRLQVRNPVAVLRTISPTQAAVGADGARLTGRGAGFNATSVVFFGGNAHSPSAVSLTEFTVDIPGTDLAEAGDVDVFVVNPPVEGTDPPEGGGTSASLRFTITAPENPVPVITSVSPQSVPAGSASVGLTITGRGFKPSTDLSVDGQQLNATITAEKIEASVPAGLFENAGTLPGLLVNGPPGGGAASFSINVVSQAPSISGFDPTSVVAGLESVRLTVTGENFTPDASVTANGTGTATTYVSSTQLEAVLTGAFIASPGSVTIGVFVPPPGGGTADGGELTVRVPPNPVPVLTGLGPSTALLEDLPLRVMVEGSGFVEESEVHVDGSAEETTYINATSLSFELTRGAEVQTLSLGGGPIAGLLAIADARTFSVTVFNPEPEGGRSDALPFTIGNPVASIDGAEPSSVAFDELPVQITLTGRGFITSSQAEVDGSAVSSTRIDANTLRFELAAGTLPGDRQITVTNPTPGGGPSNTVVVTVTKPRPSITRIRPTTGVEAQEHPIDVIGANFLAGAEILINGVATPTLFGSVTSLSGTIPPSRPGKLQIQVQNLGGVQSNAVEFTVTTEPNPAPTITSITGENADIKIGDTVTIHGLGFLPSTTLMFAGRSADLTFVSITTLRFMVPSHADGVYPVILENSPSEGGGGGKVSSTLRIGSQVTIVSNEIIVFNDRNMFKETGMDDDFESDSTPNPNNKLLVKNLVSFISSGSRNSGTVAQLDCGRDANLSSGIDICDTTAASDTKTFQAEIVKAGLTVTKVNSSSGSLISIPANVKVLVLFHPEVAYTGAEINTMKQFVADGGRIVFIGERGGFYGSTNIANVANPFLKDMGAKSTIVAAEIDGGQTKVPASSLNTTHQVMTGLTGIEHAATSKMTLDPGDTFLIKSQDGTSTVAAAVKINTTSITTAAPTLTSVSPTNPVAGQSVVMTLTGTDFTPGSTVTLTGGEVTSVSVTNVEFVSSTTLNVTISINSGHSGPYTFKVTTGNGQSGTAGFTIVNDRATVISVTPNSGVQGATVPITITGTQFAGATSVNTSAGIIVLSFTVNSNTEISAVLQLTASAGAKFVSVSNAAGSSGSVTFTITSSDITSASSLVISSLTGSQGFGTEDGPGSTAAFNTPNGSVFYNNNLYVADFVNHTIRQIVIATGVVTTLAGSPGVSGSDDGTGSAARFFGPTGIASDGSGLLFVADQNNNTIRQIVAATGVVTTLAGDATQAAGTADGTGSNARFNLPFGISCCGGAPSALYVTDSGNHSIREVVVSSGVVTTPVGVAGTPGFVNEDDNAAKFNTPKGLAEVSGVLYVADSGNNAIRKVTTAGTHTVTTFAGTSAAGTSDGTGTNAQFNGPVGVAAEGTTNLYIGDRLNHTIRKIQISNQAVSTFAGTAGSSGFVGGSATATRFNQPGFVSVDATNASLFVSDELSHAIRKTDLPGVSFSTLAGSPNPKSGSVDGTGATARFNSPDGASVDAAGNIYVSDSGNHVIRKVASGTGVVTILAGSVGNSGTLDGTGTVAQFKTPGGSAVVGNFLYLADLGNHTIRKINVTTGVVTTFAGQAGTSGAVDGAGTSASFKNPAGITTDGTFLYATDKSNHTIRKIEISTGVVSTLAGSAGSFGLTNATGTAARFNTPVGITAIKGTLYVGEFFNHTIRAITISSGAVTTLAGAGSPGFDDKPGTSAKFSSPAGITTDGTNIYVADSFNNRIRKVVISSGVVSTLAGSATAGFVNATGTAAQFNSPLDVVIDGTNLFIIDDQNHQVCKGTAPPE